MSTWHLKAEVNVNVHTGVDRWISWVNTLIKSIGLWRPNTGLNICSCQTTDTDWGEFQNQSMATVSTQHQALKYETPQYLPGKATQRYMFSVINNNDQSWSRGISIQMRTSNVLYKANYIQCCVYIQTRFQKSWDTVQIVNKNRMQWCGSFKFQYFIQNTT